MAPWGTVVVQVLLLLLLLVAALVVVGRWILHAWCLLATAKLGFHERKARHRGEPASSFLRGGPWPRAILSFALILLITFFTGFSLWIAARYVALNPAFPSWFARFLRVDQSAEERSRAGLAPTFGDEDEELAPDNGGLIATVRASQLAKRSDFTSWMVVIMLTSVAPSFTFLVISVVAVAMQVIQRRKFLAERAAAQAASAAEGCGLLPDDRAVDSSEDPYIVVCVPCYNEPLPSLMSTLIAITSSDYPPDKLKVIVGFDGYDVLTQMATMERLLTRGDLIGSGTPEAVSRADSFIEPQATAPRFSLGAKPTSPGFPSQPTFAPLDSPRLSAVYDLDQPQHSPNLRGATPPSPFTRPAVVPWHNGDRGVVRRTASSSDVTWNNSSLGHSGHLRASFHLDANSSPPNTPEHLATSPSVPPPTGKLKYNGLAMIAHSPVLRPTPVDVPQADGDHGHGHGFTVEYTLHGHPLPDAPMSWLTENNCEPDNIVVSYHGVEVHICRFEHGGKHHAQQCMLDVIERHVATGRIPARSGLPPPRAGGQQRSGGRMQQQQQSGQETMLLFIDSDTTMVKDTIRKFADHLTLHPKLQAATGFIVSRNAHGMNLWQKFEDAEYCYMQAATRMPEVLFGAVTCLPGALTAMRLSAMRTLAKVYFAQSEADSTFEYCRRKLGEDRWLTHLAMEVFPPYSIGFIPDAISKTEAPDSFQNLLKQRRRWLLGSLANEIYCLATPEFWIKYPGIVLLRVLSMLNIGGSLFYVFMVDMIMRAIKFPDLLTTADYVILVSLPLAGWLYVAAWSIWQGRLKALGYFLVYIIINPLFEAAFYSWTMLTINQRTWGGPRAAAAKTSETEEADGDGNDQV